MAATNYSKHIGGRQRKQGTRDRHDYLQRARELAPRGQDLPHSKLLEIDVIDIRSASRQRVKMLQYIRDNLSNEALAKRYGISISTLEKVVTYQTWGHVA
jgi:hypothetical protein